jgi:hypothetical protein
MQAFPKFKTLEKLDSQKYEIVLLKVLDPTFLSLN